MSRHDDDLHLKDDPDLYTDDEIDSNDEDEDDEDQDFMDEFRGYNFSRSGSMRQKKAGYVFSYQSASGNYKWTFISGKVTF